MAAGRERQRLAGMLSGHGTEEEPPAASPEECCGSWPMASLSDLRGRGQERPDGYCPPTSPRCGAACGGPLHTPPPHSSTRGPPPVPCGHRSFGTVRPTFGPVKAASPLVGQAQVRRLASSAHRGTWTCGTGFRFMEWRSAPIVIACCLMILAWLLARRSLRVQAEANRLLGELIRREGDVVLAERKVAESVERTAELTTSDARRLVEARATEVSAAYLAQVVAAAEREATALATRRAQWILVSALATETHVPRGISYKTAVALPDVQGLRARLVGRDGRNLAAFSELTGVQLSLPAQRPEAVLTSYDPERRAIAEETLKLLIEGSRVYESTIRRAYDEVARRWPSRLIAFGREAAAAANAGDIDDVLAHLMGRLHFQKLNGVSALGQAVTGARIAAVLAAEVGWSSPQLVVRAAFLRDLGYAENGEPRDHAEAGAILAARQGEDETLCRAIQQHHLFSASHSDVASSLVACAERLTVAGTENPYEAPWLGAQRMRDLETELERLVGVATARVLGLAAEVSVWVDPEEVVSEEALQALAVEAAAIARNRVAKPITVTVHRHSAWQALPNAGVSPVRWLTDPAAPSVEDVG